ncbi:MAG: hypothetical protein H8E30_17495, partial [Alphaproteobacteria bacterium]|nr:hypothetical protein [Alphaproteobacteria bacterium]
SCIEFGTFRPQAGIDFSERALLEAARKIETGYLVNHPDSRAHFMDRINAETYSEVAFVKTLGAARKICQGYLVDDACGDLLAMFDPESVDLDFWHVLA